MTAVLECADFTVNALKKLENQACLKNIEVCARFTGNFFQFVAHKFAITTMILVRKN